MGNAASDQAETAAVERVATLRDQLADMERAMRYLSRRPQIDVLLPHQLRVHGVVVSTNRDARVLVGPVVGKVDFQSARVLLEVDRAAAVTCHVLLYDERTDAFEEVPHCRVTIDPTAASAPTVFCIQSLLPGRRYRVVFSGINHEDTQQSIGSFQTPTIGTNATLQCAFVSADDACALEYGEPSMWRQLRCAIVDKQSIQLVIHLGGQVTMRRMFDKAWAVLVRHTECMDLPVTLGTGGWSQVAVDRSAGWSKLERVAMEILRAAYRTQWTMDKDKRHVLAHASNLMMWSDWDVYPAFTTSSVFSVNHEQPTLEMQVLRTVVRCARRLCHEYQRALWDDDIDELFAREADMRRVAENALATTARIHVLAKEIPAAQADLDLQKKRREIEGARKVERHLRALEAEKAKFEKMLVSYNQLLVPQGGEEFCYEIGGVAFVLLDMRSARTEPGGSQRAENEVLSNAQWAFLEEILENEALQVLFVCSESPLVDDLPHELRAGAASNAGENECDFKTWWGSNSSAQQRLIAMLFEWKLQQEGREVVFVAGSCNTRFAFRTRVRDSRLRTEIIQWMTGPITAKPTGHVVPSWSGTLFDRYAFEHEDVVTGNRAFLVAEVDCNSLVTSVRRESDAAQRDTYAVVLVGPVVGFVNAISAAVLLEVDRDCVVVCGVHNALTGEHHRFFQQFRARRPNSFFLNHLRSEHHYTVVFGRIQDPDEYQASFTTLAATPDQLRMVGINHADAGSEDPSPIVTSAQALTLWPWIKENLSSGVPFSGVNHVVHFAASSSEAAVLQDIADSQIAEEQVRESFRIRWNMPGIKDMLRRGSHLFAADHTVEEQLDEREVKLSGVIQSVENEYQSLLLPPSKRVKHSRERLERPLCFAHGAFGFFFLPDALCQPREAVDSFWLCLESFLKTPLVSTLVLVAAAPVIEDSVEDAEEKARFDPKYQHTLAFHRDNLKHLLDILLVWQGDKGDRGDRHVIFLTAHGKRSFDSVIRDLQPRVVDPLAGLKPHYFFQQFVLGPLKTSFIQNRQAASRSLELNVFPQGTLFDRFAYSHRFHRPRRQDPSTQEAKSDDSPAALQEQTAQDPWVQQLLCLHLKVVPGIDDKSEVDVTATYVATCPLAHVDASITDEASSVKGAEFALATTHGDQECWRIESAQPGWLQSLVSQPLSEGEEATLQDLQARLDEKQNEIEVSFQRADLLAKGIVGAENLATFVLLLHDAVCDFHQHLAGIALRSKYPALPSAYIVNYTLQEMANATTGASILTSAIDIEQYRSLVVKCLQNAWLFDSRLQVYWGLAT